MSQIIDEVLKTQLHVGVGLAVLWSVFGCLAGVMISFGCYLLMSKLGAFRLNWKFAAWPRTLTVLWLAVTFAILGGMMGGCEGTLRATQRVVKQSQFRTEALQPVGDAVADGLFQIDHWLREPDVPAPVDSFRQGELELSATSLLRQIDAVEEVAARKAVDATKQQIATRMGTARGGVVETLTNEFLDVIARRLLRAKAKEQLDKVGLADALFEFFDTLPAAARARGDPDTISHAELASHVVDHGLIPALLQPARRFVRTQQVVLVALSILATVLPTFAFWIARKSWPSDTPPAQATGA